MKERFKNGLADPSKSKTRKGDSELAGAECRIEIVDQVSCDLGPSRAFVDQRFELGVADFDDGKLRRHKKPVQKNEKGDDKQIRDE